jgi:hypothetical protein
MQIEKISVGIKVKKYDFIQKYLTVKTPLSIIYMPDIMLFDLDKVETPHRFW